MSGTEFDLEATSGPENAVSDDFEADGSGHMMNWRAPELETDAGGADDVIPVDQETGERVDQETGAAVVEQLSQEAFFEVFKVGFAVPGIMAPDFAPVAVQPEEQTQARAASDACYRLLEIYYPKALLSGSDKFADMVTAGSFIAGKVMIVRMILQERRTAALKAVNGRKGETVVADSVRAAPFRSARHVDPAQEETPPHANVNSPFAWADGEVA